MIEDKRLHWLRVVLAEQVAFRDRTDAARVMAGEPQAPVVHCQGFGRCPDPVRESNHVCPLCLQFPALASAKDVEEISRRYFAGN